MEMDTEFDNEIIKDAVISDQAQQALKKTQANLRTRAIDRGIVQFRADKEFMEALLDLAERRKIPAGVLCRDWVWQKLQEDQFQDGHGACAEDLKHHAHVAETPAEYSIERPNSIADSTADSWASDLVEQMKLFKEHLNNLESKVRKLSRSSAKNRRKPRRIP